MFTRITENAEFTDLPLLRRILIKAWNQTEQKLAGNDDEGIKTISRPTPKELFSLSSPTRKRIVTLKNWLKDVKSIRLPMASQISISAQ
jgi:hypothetical protein